MMRGKSSVQRDGDGKACCGFDLFLNPSELLSFLLVSNVNLYVIVVVSANASL